MFVDQQNRYTSLDKCLKIVCASVPMCARLAPHASVWFILFIHNISIEVFSKNFITKVQIPKNP